MCLAITRALFDSLCFVLMYIYLSAEGTICIPRFVFVFPPYTTVESCHITVYYVRYDAPFFTLYFCGVFCCFCCTCNSCLLKISIKCVYWLKKKGSVKIEVLYLHNFSRSVTWILEVQEATWEPSFSAQKKNALNNLFIYCIRSQIILHMAWIMLCQCQCLIVGYAVMKQGVAVMREVIQLYWKLHKTGLASKSFNLLNCSLL